MNMKRRCAFLFLAGVLALAACQDMPTAPARANLILDGSLDRTMTSYDRPQFEGYVKNVGNNAAHNCIVEIACYSGLGESMLTDKAVGYPAGFGDIPAGDRVRFHAVTFVSTSHDQIRAIKVKITWANR